MKANEANNSNNGAAKKGVGNRPVRVTVAEKDAIAKANSEAIKRAMDKFRKLPSH